MENNDNTTNAVIRKKIESIPKKGVILFVCSAGLLRSATAANIFAKRGWNTRSCGSMDYALIPISVNLIYWADKIYFMSKVNLEYVRLKFIDKSDIIELCGKAKEYGVATVCVLPKMVKIAKKCFSSV
jgi:hypothetical protein